MKLNSDIAIVIPSLNQGSELPDLVRSLRQRLANFVIVVNDGSSESFDEIFAEVASVPDVFVLRHSRNCGKGRALKTAFQEYLRRFPQGRGVVIADADGQHLSEDVAKLVQELEQMTSPRLLLGVRDFSRAGVPMKSRIGNWSSTFTLFLMTGCWCSDTQTGLRGIPGSLLPVMIKLPGERFEYETAMLADCIRRNIPIAEMVITTVYRDDNRGSHFQPFHDSWQIFQIFLALFAKSFFLFAGNGLFSALLDISCFAFLFHYVVVPIEAGRLFFSVLIARAISLCVNYLINKKVVFRTQRISNRKRPFYQESFARYLALCALIATLSWLLTWAGSTVCRGSNVVWVKIVVDAALFLLSFFLQKCWCFAPEK